MGSCRRAHIEAPRGAPAGPSLTVRFMMADNCSRFPAIQSQGRLQLYRWLITHPTRGPFGFGTDCVGLSVVCTSSAKIIKAIIHNHHGEDPEDPAGWRDCGDGGAAGTSE